MNLEFEWNLGGAGGDQDATGMDATGVRWTQTYGSRWHRGLWVWLFSSLVAASLVLQALASDGRWGVVGGVFLGGAAFLGFWLNRGFMPTAWTLDPGQRLRVRMANGTIRDLGPVVERRLLTDEDVRRSRKRSVSSLRFPQEVFFAGSEPFEVIGDIRYLRTQGLFRFEFPWVLGHSSTTWGSFSFGSKDLVLGLARLENRRTFILTAWTPEALRAGLGLESS